MNLLKFDGIEFVHSTNSLNGLNNKRFNFNMESHFHFTCLSRFSVNPSDHIASSRATQLLKERLNQMYALLDFSGGGSVTVPNFPLSEL